MPPRVVLAGSKRIRVEGGAIPPRLRDVDGIAPRTFPLCGDILRRLQEANPGLLIDQGVLRALKPARCRQAALLALRDAADAEWSPSGERLYPFQRVGARWLLAAERAILADSQGLGKTVQALVAAEAAGPRRAIVVCNDSKIADWAEHIRIWTSRTPLVLQGDAEARAQILGSWGDEFLICNFAQAALNLPRLRADLLIVDEAHNIRNRKTRAFQAIEALARVARWVFLLTASPTVNRAEDIWSLLHMVDPDRFRGFWSFACRFFDVHKERRGPNEVTVIGGLLDDERGALDRILSVYMLQRGKEHLPGLPVRTRKVVEYRMSHEQARLHRDMLLHERARSGDAVVWSEGVLSQFTRLRQIAIDPNLLFPDYDGGSKLDTLVDLIREGEGKAVVFTMFEQAALRAAGRLGAEGIKALLLTGSMSARERDEAIQRFSEEADALVVTHKTGGEGLNLVMARRAIFLDLAWHPAGNTHAEDRIYRIGQEADEVETIVIKATGSIEEHIFDIVSQKREVTIEEILRRAKDAEKRSDTQSESADRHGVSASVAPWVS